jgi:hypothetical protein
MDDALVRRVNHEGIGTLCVCRYGNEGGIVLYTEPLVAIDRLSGIRLRHYLEPLEDFDLRAAAGCGQSFEYGSALCEGDWGRRALDEESARTQ